MDIIIERWERQPNYIGTEWYEYYQGPGLHRDSSITTQTNFEVAQRMLEEAAEKDEEIWAARGYEPEGGALEYEHCNHWAVGWVDSLLVHEHAVLTLEVLMDICERLMDYPILDEDELSRREWEDKQEQYENWHEYDTASELKIDLLLENQWNEIHEATINKIKEAQEASFMAVAEYDGDGRSLYYRIEDLRERFKEELDERDLVPVYLTDGTAVSIWSECNFDELRKEYDDDELDLSNNPHYSPADIREIEEKRDAT